ncbi:MAG: histidine kinase [Ilumatobacteraceae bacterium]
MSAFDPPIAASAGRAGRETDPVSEFPPPPPPPPGTPSAHRSAPGDWGADWDWDRVRDIAERWYRPLLRPEGWSALLYLFVGMLTSLVFAAAMTAAGAITFGLLFIGLGFVLVNPVFRLVGAMVAVERRMAAMAGVPFEARHVLPVGRFGFRAARDPERWRQVGYVALNAVMASALFAAGSFAYSVVLRVVFDDSPVAGFSIFGLNPIAGLVAIAFAAFALGAAPRAAVAVAGLKANIAAWFLGPDRLAVAERRVTTLAGQRQDILDAVASERRRIERNLHDGVQQQLVAIGLDLGMAETQIDGDPTRARELIGSAREKVRGSIGELRQLGRGLHPAILEDRGIDAALSAVVSASHIPVSVLVAPDLDLSTDVAETVYFVANESIANVLKHAQAHVASVHVAGVADNVRVTVHDDGVGGVDPSKGTGIAGIRARVNAVDGSLTISSPPGGPTTIVAEIPRTRR